MLELPFVVYTQHSQAMVECGVCELAHSFFHLNVYLVELLFFKNQKWSQRAGWTKYDPLTGKATAVKYPEEDILVFDVEMLVSEGHFPTMATAVSPTNWYAPLSRLG